MAANSLTIVLAAGEGTRMCSYKPKVLHEIANLPMVCHVLRKIATTDIALVLGNQLELVKAEVEKFLAHETIQASNIFYIEQAKRYGTAHAVLSALHNIDNIYDQLIICYGDTPLIKTADLLKVQAAIKAGADVAILGFYTEFPTGYGRLVMEGDRLLSIVEESEATEDQKKINFCNGGIMGLKATAAKELLELIENNNSKAEYYLTDIVGIANARGKLVTALEVEAETLLGVNDRAQLAEVEAIWQKQKRVEFLKSGVSMQDAQSIYFSYDTVLEADVNLETNIYFGPGCYVKKGAHIKSFSHIEGAKIGENVEIGPFVRLRPGVDLAQYSKVGNFCEIKKSKIGAFSKINHLSYIGDAEIGQKTNIGAGVITCNYDGVNKWTTSIKEGVFVGSNSSLVAPVVIGQGSYIASSSIITEDVPENALAIGRAKQINKTDYALKIKNKLVKDL